MAIMMFVVGLVMAIKTGKPNSPDGDRHLVLLVVGVLLVFFAVVLVFALIVVTVLLPRLNTRSTRHRRRSSRSMYSVAEGDPANIALKEDAERRRGLNRDSLNRPALPRYFELSDIPQARTGFPTAGTTAPSTSPSVFSVDLTSAAPHTQSSQRPPRLPSSMHVIDLSSSCDAISLPPSYSELAP